MKLHFICFPTEKQTRTTRLADVLWCPRATHFCSRLNTFATLWLAVDLTFSNKQHEAHPPLTPFRQIIIITPTVNWNRTLNETLLSPVTNATCSKLYIWTVFSHHLAGNVCKDLFFSTETINCESKWQYSSQPTLACCGHFSQPPLLFFCLGLFFWKQTVSLFPLFFSSVLLVWLALVYLGIPGLTLACSGRQLGEPNRHHWSQQLERQRESCRGYGEDERLGGQTCGQRRWGSVEPWYWTELPGGPGHLSPVWTQEDHLIRRGKDVWWVEMCLHWG